MRKKTKALSGASQDAYFRRVLKAHPDLPAGERDKLLRRLRQEVAQLRVRVELRQEGDPPPVAAVLAEPAVAANARPAPAFAIEAAARFSDPSPPVSEQAPVAQPFDPFSPNVIVVLRKSGRDAVLAALGAIDSPDNLRLLAREQRLTISADASSLAELRDAIVKAAERRIANRMAAAS